MRRSRHGHLLPHPHGALHKDHTNPTSPPPPVNPYQQAGQSQGAIQNPPPRYSTISPPPIQQIHQPMHPSPQSTFPPQNSFPSIQAQSPTATVQSTLPPGSIPQPAYQHQLQQNPIHSPLPTPPPPLKQPSQTIHDPRMSSPPPVASQQSHGPPQLSPPMQSEQQQQISNHPPPGLSSNTPQNVAAQPSSNYSPPNAALTPAPLNLRPRANSNVPQPQRPLSALSMPPVQPGAVQQPDSRQPQNSSSGSSPPAGQTTPLQRYPSQPIVSSASYQPFTRSETQDTSNSDLSGSHSQQPNSSPPPVSQYQAFSGSIQPPVHSPQLHFDQQPQEKRQQTISPPPASITPAPPPTAAEQEQSYAAFKPNNPPLVQNSSPKVGAPLPYPASSSPDQVTPLFSAPQNEQHDSINFSQQNATVSPKSGHDSPLSINSTLSSRKPFETQDSIKARAVELPSGAWEMPVSQKNHTSVPDAPQGKSAAMPAPPMEYADGLMLADEDTSFVPAPRNSTFVPPRSPAPVSVRKTKCAGFEATLTDTNQYFEMRPEFMAHYNIPMNDGGAFAICEYCFYTFLGPHPWFAGHFHPRPKASRPTDPSLPQISFEKLIGCGLAFPRIRQVILGQAIPSHNLQPFIEYAKLDAALPPCTGEPQGGSYYGSKAIESIAVCTSCFECYIKSTAFERHFSLQNLPSPDQQWACDIGYSGYVHRTLLQDIAQNPPNFNHFVAAANKRLSMPPCTGHKQPIACSGPQGSTIFRSVKDNCGVFCSGCFHDKVVGTPAERDFGYEIEIDDDQKAALSCDLTFEFSKDAMDNAVKANNFDVWHAPIVANNTAKLCPSITGIDEKDLITSTDEPMWYCFRDFPSIEVCGKCYGTRAVTCQAQELFMPVTRAPVPGRIRQCYLSPAKDMHSGSFDPLDYENTTAWRGQYLRNMIQYGMDAGGDFTVARQAAAHIASLPPPCGSELRKFTPASGRKFFGHQASNPNDKNDATILMCEECFHATAKGTPMEPFFANDLTTLAYQLSPEGHRCSTWSVQTKRRLKEACLTNSFANYAQYHHQREQVFEALWTSMRELAPLNELLKQHTANINRQTELNLQMGSLRLQQQLNNQMNAQIMGIGGSVAEASTTDYGIRYGNSTVGMNYLTPAGANAAMAQHQAANLPGLNLAMWQGASTERLTGEVQRRLDIQNELREQWRILD